MNSTKKKHPNGHTAGHRGAKIKEKPAKLPHARAREADAKPPPARSNAPVVDHPPAQRSTSPIAAAAVAPALLWFSGRTGSTWLTAELNAAPGVSVIEEALKQGLLAMLQRQMRKKLHLANVSAWSEVSAVLSSCFFLGLVCLSRARARSRSRALARGRGSLYERSSSTIARTL